MPRWSKLQRELYRIVAPDIGLQIHCSRYRMQSQYGKTDLPRYWITLKDEIIFDYPKQFVGEDGAIRTLREKEPWDGHGYPYVTDISEISKMIREYIDTKKDEVFEKPFENDYWGLTDILKAADRRNGKRRLESLKEKTDSEAANKIIELRLEKKAEK